MEFSFTYNIINHFKERFCIADTIGRFVNKFLQIQTFKQPLTLFCCKIIRILFVFCTEAFQLTAPRLNIHGKSKFILTKNKIKPCIVSIFVENFKIQSTGIKFKVRDIFSVGRNLFNKMTAKTLLQISHLPVVAVLADFHCNTGNPVFSVLRTFSKNRVIKELFQISSYTGQRIRCAGGSPFSGIINQHTCKTGCCQTSGNPADCLSIVFARRS